MDEKLIIDYLKYKTAEHVDINIRSIKIIGKYNNIENYTEFWEDIRIGDYIISFISSGKYIAIKVTEEELLSFERSNKLKKINESGR